MPEVLKFPRAKLSSYIDQSWVLFSFSGRRFYSFQSVEAKQGGDHKVIAIPMDRYGTYPASKEADGYYLRWVRLCAGDPVVDEVVQGAYPLIIDTGLGMVEATVRVAVLSQTEWEAGKTCHLLKISDVEPAPKRPT